MNSRRRSTEEDNTNAEETRKLQSNIWKPVNHNRDSIWLKKMSEEVVSEKQSDLRLSNALMNKVLKKCQIGSAQEKIYSRVLAKEISQFT